MDIRAGYVNVHNGKLFYEEAGHGFPLVLLHNTGSNLRLWDEQFTIFAREYRVIRYDLRGHGHSDPAAGHYSHVFDLVHLLRGLQIERAFLVGCALGASTAVDFAIEYPELTAGLVLVNPALSGYSYETETGPVDFLPVQNRVLPPLNVIRCPLMVMTGEVESPAITGGLRHILRALPDAKKSQLPGTALLPNIGRPLQFNRIVLTFLEWARLQKPRPAIDARPRVATPNPPPL